MKKNLRLDAAAGPTTREQLARRTGQHDRMWDRIVRAGIVIFALGLFGLAGLATIEAFQTFNGVQPSTGTTSSAR